MACTKCGDQTGSCNHDCETVDIPFECCPQKDTFAKPVCDLPAATITCPAENRSLFSLGDTIGGGGDNCPCVPCPDDIVFSPEQKAYLTEVFEGMIKQLIPAVHCDCEIQPIVAHMWPVKPQNTAPVLDEEGNPTGCHTAVDPVCCGPYGSLANSPFVSNGESFGIRNHPYATGRPNMPGIDALGASREGMDALLKVLCCGRDTILGAETVEMMEQNLAAGG